MQKFIYGYHAIEEQIKAGRLQGRLLVAGKQKRTQQLIQLARQKQIQVLYTSTAELDRYCDPKKHKGALLIVHRQGKPGHTDFKAMIKEISSPNPLVLLLDSITDPHNFGAVLRSADQFYADLVITTGSRSARETETVAAAASGANVYVKKAVVANLNHVIDFLQKEGYWVYGADMTGTRADTVDLKGKTALVMGSEGSGIRRLVKEKCDQLICIPARGHVGSLNVSVAAGILMYEARRQQGFV